MGINNETTTYDNGNLQQNYYIWEFTTEPLHNGNLQRNYYIMDLQRAAEEYGFTKKLLMNRDLQRNSYRMGIYYKTTCTAERGLQMYNETTTDWEFTTKLLPNLLYAN